MSDALDHALNTATDEAKAVAALGLGPHWQKVIDESQSAVPSNAIVAIWKTIDTMNAVASSQATEIGRLRNALNHARVMQTIVNIVFLAAMLSLYLALR